MNKGKMSDSIVLDTFTSKHPFVVAGKGDFEKINNLVEKYRYSSKYSEKLMLMKPKVMVSILDDMDEFAGLYSSDMIFINRYDLKNNEKNSFLCLIHEYIHHLQDFGVREFNYNIKNKWNDGYKNNIQDFYICMVMEADAYTKEALVFKKNITSDDMNKMFFSKLKSIASKVNYDRDYHCYFNYLKMKMKPIFLHPDFVKITKTILSAGLVSTGGAFPDYTFTFSDLSEVLDEIIIENKKFEMLKKVNHWSEDEAHIKILRYPYEYEKNVESDWVPRLNKFCETSSNNKNMKKLLSSFTKVR